MRSLRRKHTKSRRRYDGDLIGTITAASKSAAKSAGNLNIKRQIYNGKTDLNNAQTKLKKDTQDLNDANNVNLEELKKQLTEIEKN